LLISEGGGLSLVGVGGAPSSTLTGCPGNVSAFSWDGAVVVAATDTGWLCSWRSPSADATRQSWSDIHSHGVSRHTQGPMRGGTNSPESG
jgi:hypothetical protein